MAEVNLPAALPAHLPSWLNVQPDALAEAFASTAHRERWKYTRPKQVLEVLELSASEPTWLSVPEGISLNTITDGDVIKPFSAQEARAPVAVFNLCHRQSLIVIDVDAPVSEPLCIDYQEPSLPILLRLGANASLDLRETTNGDADVYQSLWIELGPGSRLTHSRQAFGAGRHWQHLAISQDRDSHYSLHNHCVGAALKRQDVTIASAASGAHTEITSAAFLPERTHFDLQVTMEHQARNATSRQRVHNIAANAAKATFNGRIHIHQNAGGVDAELSNKNLTLGDAAVINTKPELEIYTDDVKCAHGATVGQIDPAHLFYCASRGIGPNEARRLLSQAFIASCTEGPLGDASRDRFAGLLQ